MEQDLNIVTLIDDDGNEVEFDHLLTFTHLDKMYIALLPMDDSPDLPQDEVLLFEIAGTDGYEKYVPIENEVLLDEVFEVFIDLFNEKLEEEEGD